jgi:hypothetical protein
MHQLRRRGKRSRKRARPAEAVRRSRKRSRALISIDGSPNDSSPSDNSSNLGSVINGRVAPISNQFGNRYAPLYAAFRRARVKTVSFYR